MISEFILLYPITAYVFLGLFSLAIGSLLNVIIYRLPLMLQSEWTFQCRDLLKLPNEPPPSDKINLFFPRSFCPGCKNAIPFWHNLPIVSYCLLRGHCHKCHQTIPFRYPLIEAVCLGLSVSAAIFLVLISD